MIYGNIAQGNYIRTILTRRDDMSKITPFLWFSNCALAAAEYYTAIFPNSKIESIMHKEDNDNNDEENIITVSFVLDGQYYIGLNGGNQFQFNEAVSFSISCESQEEIDYYWEKISEQGQKGNCGWLKDKFGLSWQVVPSNMGEIMSSNNQEVAKKKMQRMLAMNKIIIRELVEI